MEAAVVAPRDAPGSRPLVLFLHGQSPTCHLIDDPTEISQEWPCPAGSEPIPSYRGYLQTQDLLASQGYVTVSISANSLNAQRTDHEQARSSLIRLHLGQWAAWNGDDRASAPEIVQESPPADLSRVLLVGHSLGGDGVNRAALDSVAPPAAAQDGYRGKVEWRIRGLVLIAPTFDGQNPLPDLPSLTILPGCDGNLVDLPGQMHVDATRLVGKGRALHSAVYVVGANHFFFNSEWTAGVGVAPLPDDALSLQDPVCDPSSPTRLTAAEQRAVGATYVAAGAALFLAGDDEVRPLLDGSGARTRSVGDAVVLSHAVGAGRTALVVPGPATEVRGGRLCREVTDDPATSCLPPDTSTWTRSPHFVPMTTRTPGPEAGRYAVDLAPRKGRTVIVRPADPVDLGGSTDLALRIAVTPEVTGKRLAVAVVDDRGRRTRLGRVRIDGLPGSSKTVAYWAQEVRVPLGAVRGRVAALELTPLDPLEDAFLIDAWGWRAGTPAPGAAAALRLDLGERKVAGSTAGIYRVPVRVAGRGQGTVRFFAIDDATEEWRSWTATVTARQTSVRVPFVLFDGPGFGSKGVTVAAKAVRRVLVGDYLG